MDYDDRVRLLRLTPLELYTRTLQHKRASELYGVLHTFNAGITAHNPVMA